MKFSTAIYAAAAASSVNAAALERRHYTFPSLSGTSSWQYVRQTDNYQSNGPVTDVTSEQIRCYTSGVETASTYTAAAGSTISFNVNPSLYHPGPLQFYLAKVPAGSTAATFDGSGSVWFKIYTEPAIVSNGQLSWKSLNSVTASVALPKSLPSGDYLLRVEHIALHTASTLNGAQIYLSCAQLTVTGGGAGTPSPLVAFPGAYSPTDPGLKINIYSGATGYTPPGPAVWTG